MLKKMIIVFTVLLLCISLLSSCSNESAEENNSNENIESANDDELKVVLLIGGYTGDKAFFDSANRGLQEIEEKYSAKTKLIEMGIDQTKWEANIMDVSEQDWDIIITGTWAVKELMEKVAPEYPDKKYILFDCAVDFDNYDLSNVYAMAYKQNEAAFLAGVFAAEVAKSDMEYADNNGSTLGFVGGMDIPVINDFLVGYVEGAQYITPDIKILTSYIGDFVDAPKAKELATQQYNQNVDILFTPTSSATLGSLEAAFDTSNYIIGVDSDQAMLIEENNPKNARFVLTSALKNVDNSLVRAMDLYMEDTIIWGQLDVLGVSDGAVGLAKNKIYETEVQQDIKDKLESIEEKIVNGEIKISTAFGMDSEQLNNIRNSVKP